MALDQRILPAPCFAAAMMLCGAALADAGPAGVWINDTGRGAIEIKPCGDALCGHVVWLKDSADAKGCGKQIIGDAAKVAANTWDNGWIYSPEKKARYDVELKPLDNGTLRVTGYAGTKFFSKTMIWTRAPANLARCDQGQAAAKPAPVPAVKPAGAAAAPETKPTPTTTASLPEAKAAPEVNAVEPVKAEPPEVAGTPPPAPAEPQLAATPEPKPEAVQPAPAAPAATPAATRTAEPAPAPAAKPKTASRHADNGGEDRLGNKSKRRLRLGNLNLDGLKLDKVLKRTASGNCKLDLPWVKVRFRCED